MKTRCEPCGKVSYRRWMEAVGVALRCSKRFGGSLRVYRCPHSSRWHLTTKPLRVAS